MTESYKFTVNASFVATAIKEIARSELPRYNGVSIQTSDSVEFARYDGDGVWSKGRSTSSVVQTCGVMGTPHYRFAFDSPANAFMFRCFLSDYGQKYRLTP